jgi:replicative DNA helicase
MTNKQLYQRIISRESGIVLNRITRAQSFIGDEPQIFESANKSLSELKDYMEFHDDVYTIGDIKRYARGRDVIFVDYVQLVIPGSSYKGNRYAEMGAISHEFRRMAKKLNCAIVLLAQLNRVSESLATKEPSMSELREAGDLEQDAAQIILLWNKTEDRKTKGIKVDKNRHGEPGVKLEMSFDGAVNKFSPVADLDNPFV